MTLWGESAGAMSVGIHYTSPKSKGLFSKVGCADCNILFAATTDFADLCPCLYYLQTPWSPLHPACSLPFLLLLCWMLDSHGVKRGRLSLQDAR